MIPKWSRWPRSLNAFTSLFFLLLLILHSHSTPFAFVWMSWRVLCYTLLFSLYSLALGVCVDHAVRHFSTSEWTKQKVNVWNKSVWFMVAFYDFSLSIWLICLEFLEIWTNCFFSLYSFRFFFPLFILVLFFFSILFIDAGRFQRFDYGPHKNLKLYNSTKPPEYNLTNVQTKVHILYGTNDNLVVPEVCVFWSDSLGPILMCQLI